ncbi:MAG TPA: RNA polymerase sigma factor [Terracidiphilus sp.]|nr:RNA polymerase sigma factor [Terracidiphilus sp.]
MNSREGETMAAANAALPIAESGELSRLFGEHHRRVLLAAYRITGSMADAEDVAQAVFLRLANGSDLAMKNAGSYLYRAAINGALDLLRKRKAAASEPLDAAAGVAWAVPGSSPEEVVTRHQLGRWLLQAIGELPARAAEMFTLRYLEELDNREIAALMGTSQAVVAVTLYQARSKLKKRLGGMERGTR